MHHLTLARTFMQPSYEYEYVGIGRQSWRISPISRFVIPDGGMEEGPLIRVPYIHP